jgi:hypothetical protein
VHVLPHEIAHIDKMQRVQDTLHEMGDWMPNVGDAAVDSSQAQDNPQDPPAAMVYI